MNSFRFSQLLCLLCILLVPGRLAAGEPNDSTYRLVAVVGAGGSLYTEPAGTPSGLSADVSRVGPAATFRILWRPDHLLSVGLETGWTKLYSYTTTGDVAGKVYLSQMPLYIVWSMRFADAFNVLGGYGYSRLNTHLEYGGTVNTSSWSMGWIAACSYEHPVARALAVAAELKWVNVVESHDAAVTLQVQLVYSFLEW